MGRGGGLGKFEGRTLAEIEASYEKCLADPSMRSVNAVLRICREQLVARGHLGAYPQMAILFGVLALVASVVTFGFLPEEHQSLGRVFSGVLAFADAALWGGVISVRHERKAALAQEAEIRRLTLDTLEKLLETPFPRKAMEREKVQTLQELLKRDPRPKVAELLES